MEAGILVLGTVTSPNSLPCDEGRWPSTLPGAVRVKEDRAWEVNCP